MSWKEWFLRDYARYFYFILSLAIVIFGVGEVLRAQPSPVAPLTLVLWILLLVSVVTLLILGYILLWRRDSRAGRRIVTIFSSLLRPGD